MHINLFSVVILGYVQFCVLLASKVVSNTSKSKILSRSKRYVAFPEGSSFSEIFSWLFLTYKFLNEAPDEKYLVAKTAGCITVGLIGQPAAQTVPATFTVGLNWAIAYELPNSTETAAYYHSYKRKITNNKHMLQRKHRRDLYGKLEHIIDNMGYNGRDCILKTLCETSQRLEPRGDNMIEEMFRILFTLPPTKVLQIEPLEHLIYDAAHRLGHVLDGCEKFNCPLSLVDLMKGYYNAPAPTSDTIAKSPWSFISSSFA